MEKRRDYTGTADIKRLQEAVENVLRMHELDVSTVPEVKGFIVHGRKKGLERDLTGSAYEVTVTARPGGDQGTTVTVAEELIGKAAVGLVLGILTGGIGALIPAWFAYQQHQIAEKVWVAVDGHMAAVAGNGAAV
jgi:hypothetical protein